MFPITSYYWIPWSALIDVSFLLLSFCFMSNWSHSCYIFSGNVHAINLNPRPISHDSKDTRLAFVNWKVSGEGGDDLCPWYPARQRHSHGDGLSHSIWEGQMSVYPRTIHGDSARWFLENTLEVPKWELRWAILSQGLVRPLKQWSWKAS